MEYEFAAFVAIDWADQRHAWALEVNPSSNASLATSIIRRNPSTSGQRNSPFGFPEGRSRLPWNSRADRWFSC